MQMINSASLQTFLEEFRINIKKSKSSIETNIITENLVTSIVGSEFSSIWIYDKNRAILLRKRYESKVRELSTLEKKGVMHKAFMTKEAMVCNNLPTEIEYDDAVDNPDGIKMKSKIIVPLLDNDRLIGIATAYSSVNQIENFSEYSFNLFKMITPYILDSVYKMKEYKGVERRAQKAKEDDVEIILQAKKLEIPQKSTQESTQNVDEVLRYMAGVVHDIRTPANSLYGFLDLLEEKLEDPRLREFVKNAKESASFINELTTSILDKASNPNKESEVKAELVNSALFFSKISELFVSNMYKKKISFNIFIDPLLPREIIVESMKLKRVIMNLIGNAYKFTPTNECIEFSVRYKKKDKKIHIFVKDTGIGIAKSKQEAIFEAFKQAEDDTSDKYGGHGLGLSICAAYVKDLGGNLRIDSEIDEGSTFYFDIPLEFDSEESMFKPIDNSSTKVSIFMDTRNSCSAHNIARYLVRMGLDKTQIEASRFLERIDEQTTHMVVFESRETAQLLSFCKQNSIKLLVVEENLLSLSIDDSSDENLVISQYSYFADVLYAFIDINKIPKVLIIDDDRISRSLIKNILSEELCKIETAYNGEVGLELINNSIKNKNPYTMIYLDNFMPLLSGDELVNTLRIQEKKTAIKPAYVASISGDATNEKNTNYDVYTSKPFNKEEIKEIYYKAISR